MSHNRNRDSQQYVQVKKIELLSSIFFLKLLATFFCQQDKNSLRIEVVNSSHRSLCNIGSLCAEKDSDCRNVIGLQMSKEQCLNRYVTDIFDKSHPGHTQTHLK